MATSRKLALNSHNIKDPIWIALLWGLFLFSACGGHDGDAADRLNEAAYSWHYRNLDSVRVYANRAYNAADGYADGQAEALNNLAFTQIMLMDYPRARQNLSLVSQLTDNQVELLVADVQMMRICQRQSSNKEFYDYHEVATRRLRRIEEEQQLLNAHQSRRFVYARSEFAIVTSTYYYYVGLSRQSKTALMQLQDYDELARDTAQLVNYYYNIGAGGILTDGSPADITQQEFDYLMRCYMLSLDRGYTFFIANSLQSLSEHLTQTRSRQQLVRDDMPAIRFLNIDNVADTLLAGNLAERSLRLFATYGDPYQMAGSYRTLAGCYQAIGDYPNAIVCLNNALERNHIINRAPDLVASIREQLSVAWAAIGDKPMSDMNRNLYLDLQESTRQDRYLEARAAQLSRSSRVLNIWIGAVITAIVLLLVLLAIFDRLRHRASRRFDPAHLLQPLEQWEKRAHAAAEEQEQQMAQLREEVAAEQTRLDTLKRLYIDQRAKIQFVKSMLPLVDRMRLELSRLLHRSEDAATRKLRLDYINELASTLNDENKTLTAWIQLRRGQLGIHVETFALEPLFEMLRGAGPNFSLRGIELEIDPTTAVVKADKVLTLFMLNTLADNARKFTPRGGRVTISASEAGQMVEIAVADTGCGIAPDQLAGIFDPKALADQQTADDTAERSHGYGLMNCKGIIEKYRKTSRIFADCSIKAESRVGQGSRFSFTLPKGVLRLLLPLLLLMVPARAALGATDPDLTRAAHYADSAYFSNIAGHYAHTLQCVDTVLACFNRHLSRASQDKLKPLRMMGSTAQVPPEIAWYQAGLQINYTILLDARNECAVAALALHRWSLYRYNNNAYTKLFREVSADNTLGQYCRTMQRAEQNKNVAIILLILLLIAIPPAYYFIYYRHVVYFKFCVSQLGELNSLLLSDISADRKLQAMRRMPIDRFPSQLADVARKVMRALEQWVTDNRDAADRASRLKDNIARLSFEASRLHVSNSVIDNCLSSLKHETMYYPARISMLAAEGEQHLEDIAELADYYQRLFSVLLGQALSLMRPVGFRPVSLAVPGSEARVMADPVMLGYLLAILQKANGNRQPRVEAAVEGNYVLLTFHLDTLRLEPADAAQLFSTEHGSPDFLVCRQIVRDSGDLTRHLSCGISASPAAEGTLISVKLAKGK